MELCWALSVLRRTCRGALRAREASRPQLVLVFFCQGLGPHSLDPPLDSGVRQAWACLVTTLKCLHFMTLTKSVTSLGLSLLICEMGTRGEAGEVWPHQHFAGIFSIVLTMVLRGRCHQ